MAAVPADRRYVRGRRCPICDGADGDQRGSERRCFGFLSEDGQFAHCSREERAGSVKLSEGSQTYGHRRYGPCACGTQHAAAETDPAQQRRIVAEYDYRDESGTLVYQVVRFEPKGFRQRRPDPEHPDRWLWNLEGVRRVLYRLDRVLEAPLEQTIYVVEGEKDVEALETLGLVATCNPQGAGRWAAVAECSARALAGRRVVVIPDGDDKGRKHAAEVATALAPIATVHVLELPGAKDAADWIRDGGTAEQLELLVNKPAAAERSRIVISTDQPAMVSQAIEALRLLGGVYVRGRQLVHVVRDQGAPDWLQRPAGSPVIVPIERDHLLDLLCRAAAWVGIKDGVERPVVPPVWVAARILTRGEWPLPQLESISDAPVFRADGSIQDSPGYDERTRIVFDPCGETFPAILERPSLADAQRALAELEEPFSEFPFVADCDRAAAVALVLSPIARAAIPGNVPMFGVQAPTPGSGKGLLADVAAMIPTGRRAPLMAPTDEDEETRKRLLAIAMESPPIVVIDNVDGALGSPSLAMALTAGQVSDRLLGSTRMVTASLRPVWAFTGNNVQLRGDLGRRVVPIDLDPGVEHPEDRTFERVDLLGYVRSNRPRLAVAALTLLRAFVVAGRPAHGMTAKGSFEEWDRLVRGAIIWAGGADPLGGVTRIRDRADEDLDRLRALLSAWHDQVGSVQHSIASVIKLAGTSGDLHDALVAYCRSGRPEAKPIGYAFRKLHGRPAGSLVLRRESIDRNGIALWAVSQFQ